jgi:murein DD-endopeptidase MepM/ murein hydrolase activator NlpD
MRKIKGLLLILISFISLNFVVVNASTDAKTLAELRKELQALKDKKASSEYQKKKTTSEINSAQSSIETSRKEITKGQEQIETAKAEIEVLKDDIDSAKDKMLALMNSYQKTQGDNIYLEYLFESDSYADFVYRYTIIKQLVDYNEEQIEEMQDKITTNEELQVELEAKEVELNNTISSLEKSIDSLGSQLEEINEETMDIQDEIDSTQELIDFYKDIGCGENEDLDTCVSVKGDTKFRKPLTKGTITSYYGYRTHPITGVKKFHSGTDLGGNSEGTSVYATANGMVGKIIRKASCGGNQVYIYHTIGGKQYTSGYMHLLSINVSVGDVVTSNTVIGTVGGGKSTQSYDSCTTGAHLHFILATGWYGKTYVSYSTFLAKTIDPQKTLNLPNKYSYWYSR